ncbi:hypothetical protein PIIN_10127 [Serendipita indica DSM 11827]|uniref:Uncharacterized protein n=1 Tax=Serendipita indica (strain DSM 11827) TaxID=1109443 RepID=G4TXT4_SERID|nr:hypothetical protein PIIN_10127 [Serendipita indica DSM 11827]
MNQQTKAKHDALTAWEVGAAHRPVSQSFHKKISY